MEQVPTKKQPELDWAKGEFVVTDSFFEPMDDEFLTAFDGDTDDCDPHDA